MKRKQGKSNTQQKIYICTYNMYKCDDDITSFKYVQQQPNKQQETSKTKKKKLKEEKKKKIRNEI